MKKCCIAALAAGQNLIQPAGQQFSLEEVLALLMVAGALSILLIVMSKYLKND